MNTMMRKQENLNIHKLSKHSIQDNGKEQMIKAEMKEYIQW